MKESSARSLNKILHTAAVCVAAVLAAVSPAAGQTARLLRFEAAVQDFGSLRYDAAPVTVRFVCTNIADKPVSIVDVHVQCGCTVPSWGKESIAPGAKGFVDVVLDPASLVGPQKRHLTVIATNGDYRKYSTITLEGVVLRDETLDQIRHPHQWGGGLRTDLDVIGLRLWKAGSVIERPLSVMNDSDVPMRMRWSCPSRRAKVTMPALIQPGKTVTATVRYDTAGLPEGEYTDEIYLYVGETRYGPILLKGAVENPR